MRYFISAVSHRCAMMSGQKKNSRSRRSMKSTGLVSGNPGASAMVNGGDQLRFVPVPTRAADEHVVRRPLAGAVEPADEQIAFRRFDDRRGVIVPGLERKDDLAGVIRRGGRRARRNHRQPGNHESSGHDPAHGRDYRRLKLRDSGLSPPVCGTNAANVLATHTAGRQHAAARSLPRQTSGTPSRSDV